VAAGMMAVGYGRAWRSSPHCFQESWNLVGGIVGAGAVAFSDLMLPWALAFAAGAMLYVISSEVIPETHRPGFEARRDDRALHRLRDDVLPGGDAGLGRARGPDQAHAAVLQRTIRRPVSTSRPSP